MVTFDSLFFALHVKGLKYIKKGKLRNKKEWNFHDTELLWYWYTLDFPPLIEVIDLLRCLHTLESFLVEKDFKLKKGIHA